MGRPGNKTVRKSSGRLNPAGIRVGGKNGGSRGDFRENPDVRRDGKAASGSPSAGRRKKRNGRVEFHAYSKTGGSVLIPGPLDHGLFGSNRA